MEWVETTGKSVEEALERALAHLGVHRDDAEIEILEEPRAGLFGRVRGEARVRARVRPSGPRPKRTSEGRRGGRGRGARGAESTRPEGAGDRPRNASGPSRPKGKKSVEEAARASGAKPAKAKAPAAPRESKSKEKEETMADGLSLAEQGAIAKEFVTGLLAAMEIEAAVSLREIDEETVEVAVDADPPTQLGVLVGPRGTTLQALQEITRTAVQAKNPGRTDRILVDVARYRERRVAALGRFAQQVAKEVEETGEERALEPMSAADRKAVHDALTGSSTVVTRSEGEEPRRFVVVSPA